MKSTTRRAGAIGIIVLSLTTLAGCGSSDVSTGVTPVATTTTPTSDEVLDSTNGSVAPDSSSNLVYVDLKNAIIDFRSSAEMLPTDIETLLDQLNTHIADAEGATTAGAAEGYATVKADIDAIFEQITNSTTIGVDVKAGWEQVKGEFDNIDAVF